MPTAATPIRRRCNYFGPVSFNYTASDGTLSASSTASLNLGHVDQAAGGDPGDAGAGAENAAYTIHAADLLAGVSDVDGPSLSITALSVANGGGSLVANETAATPIRRRRTISAR